MEGRRKYGDAERVILASNKFFSHTMDDVRVRFPDPSPLPPMVGGEDGRRRRRRRRAAVAVGIFRIQH